MPPMAKQMSITKGVAPQIWYLIKNKVGKQQQPVTVDRNTNGNYWLSLISQI